MRKKGIKAATSGLTLQEGIALFLARYKKTSQQTYGYNLGIFALFVGPDVHLKSITEMSILAYQKHVEGRDLAKATQATYLKMVKVFFNWLASNRLLSESPARLLRVGETFSPVDKEKAMTDRELNLSLDMAKRNPRDLALILFLADTGGRVGGAAGLKWSHIDFEHRTAFVTEKGQEARPVSFGVVCARALQALKESLPETAGPYVFSSTDRPIRASSLSRIVRRICVRAGGRSLGGHSLRHRKGHQLAYALTPPTLAARVMGHSKPETTLSAYYPVTWTRVDEVMQDLAVKDRETELQSASTPTRKPEPPRLIVLKKGG